MSLGKINPDNRDEKFSMSVLAANMSQNVNGVSMLHGAVSQEIFANMYPGYLPEELYISYVTNGVHYPTWAAREWKRSMPACSVPNLQVITTTSLVSRESMLCRTRKFGIPVKN